MKTLSLRVKFTLIMVALSLLSAGTVGLVILFEARKSISSLSMQHAKNDSEASASNIIGFIEPHWFSVEAIGQMMERYEDLPRSERRSFFNAALENLVNRNQGILAAWCNWEPNTLEGNDLEYINVPGTERNGRFAPYWFRTPSGIKVETLVNYNKPGEGDYYLLAKNSGNTTLLDPYLYKINGKDVLITSIAVPIRSKKGIVLGVIGIDISIEEIQKISQARKPLGDAITAVFSNNGTIAGHFDTTRIGKKIQETESDMLGPYLETYMNHIKEGKPYSLVRYIPAIGSDMVLFFSPIRIGESTTPWSFAVAISNKTLMAPVYNMIKIAIYVSVAMLVAVIVVASFMARSISKPIIRVTNTIKNISEGEGDLTKRIRTRAGGEIGVLVNYFNKLMDTLQHPIKETKIIVSYLATSAGKLSSVSNRLSDISKETVNQVSNAANTSEQMAENIKAMANGAEQASVNASEVAGAAEQISVNISTVASAIEEMSTSIRQISGNAGEARHIAKDATEKSNEATKAINKLGIAAKGIGQVTSVIKKIADKTNLLALNATIQAAGAGEAGKGFAVVAGEIKELANQSAQSADDIANRIEGIQSETSAVIEVIHEVSSIIVKINQSVESIAGHVEQQTRASNEISNNVAQANMGAKRVASAIGEVAKGTNEIASNVTQASAGAKRVASAINEVAKGSRDIAANAGEAVKGTDNIKENMAAASKVAEESNQGTSQVSTSASNLAKMADGLRNAIDKFKV